MNEFGKKKKLDGYKNSKRNSFDYNKDATAKNDDQNQPKTMLLYP